MAEKYGTIPPKFTKDWWGYVWEYYKLHILATLVVLAFVGSYIHSCATQVHYDVTVVHIDSNIIGEDVSEALRADLGDKINDIDANDEKNIEFMSMTIMDAPGFEEQDMAMQTKFFLSFTHDTTYLYLVSDEQCRNLIDNASIADYFLPVEDWGIDVEKNLSPEDGGDYGIALDDNAYLKEKGCITEGLRLMIRPYYADADDSGNGEGAFENAKILAQEILK